VPRDFLHNHPQFADLIRIVAEERSIDPALVEKDYWIMHCLYGLQRQNFTSALKGGTSLSKGHQIINRFSEDIDILIEPSPGQDVKPARTKTAPLRSKRAQTITSGLQERSRLTVLPQLSGTTRLTTFRIIGARASG
jgi:hypothetical protein